MGIWNEFFFFSRGERSGVLILLSLVGLMFAVNFCLPKRSLEEKEMLQLKQQIESERIKNESVKGDSVRQTDQTILCEKHDSTNERKFVHKKEYKVYERAKNYPIRSGYDSVMVEINEADTTELKRLRGIGSVLSARIVKYRHKIGGFKSVEQLREVYGLSEETYKSILPHVWIRSSN